MTYRHHMITVTVLNVSSDLMMLCIPVPMIARARLPLRRKIVLCLVFSLGVLTCLVAILNRYFNFTQNNSLVFLIWYNAEMATAVMIANIPFCWPLLRKLFALDSWSNSSDRRAGPSDIAGSGQPPPTIGTGSKRRRPRDPHTVGFDDMTYFESTEVINGQEANPDYELGEMVQASGKKQRARSSNESDDPELGTAVSEKEFFRGAQEPWR